MSSEQARRENVVKERELMGGEGREELDSGAGGLHGEKARHTQLLASGDEGIRERKGQEARETGHVAAQKGREAKEQAGRAKDTTAEKAKRASEYLTEKRKETGNVAAQKGQEAKEQTVSITGKAKDNTVQKAGEAVEMSKEAGEYAKETMVEGGKEAAHYAGVAAEKAAAAGWTAAHFTTEKVVQGTKAVAGTVEGAVGYGGQKTAEVGSKAVDLTKEKAAAAADTVVEYTGRKKEEAQRKDQQIHQVRKRSGQGLPQNQGEALEKNMEKKERVVKMHTGMEQKEWSENRGEMFKKKGLGRHEHGATDYMGHEHGHR